MRISDWSSDVCSSDLTPTTLLANLDASRDTHPSGRQLERLATHVGGEALLFVAAGVAAGEQDVVQHLLGDITSAQVVGAWDRRPGRTAANRSIKGLVKEVEVGDIGGPVDAGVPTPVNGGAPIPPATAHLELTFQSQ